MSWIIPTFGDEEYTTPPPKKKRLTDEAVTSRHLLKEDETISSDWLQKYKPKKISELAVHVKKVKDLENWLLQSGQSSANKLLLLTGPSGCGKTTALETVCKNLGFNLSEWITPVDKFETYDSTQEFDLVRSPVQVFEEYLFKSSRYISCVDSRILRTVIMVKDFPNIFLFKPSTFHELMEKISTKRLNNPVVFICSEASLCRKLFPNKLKYQLPIIRFNPITNIQMLKVLKKIIIQEKKVNKEIQISCDKTLSVICNLSKGDIRSAISELYFHSVKPSFQGTLSHQKTPEKFKDSRIDFFHGIGKVLSPKKTNPKETYKFTSTPDTLVENFLGESKDFVNRLNENFYTKFNTISDLSNAAQKLATSDILVAKWEEKEIFHEYALSVAVRGVMLSNSDPQEPTFQFYGKQETYHFMKDTRDLQLEGKFLFYDECHLDYQCLCDILPHAKCLLRNLNSAQENYLRKTFNF